jgi:hypothetical protein
MYCINSDYFFVAGSGSESGCSSLRGRRGGGGGGSIRLVMTMFDASEDLKGIQRHGSVLFSVLKS